ncbi:hypothetical protein ES707_22839 [subsurface metagenome]
MVWYSLTKFSPSGKLLSMTPPQTMGGGLLSSTLLSFRILLSEPSPIIASPRSSLRPCLISDSSNFMTRLEFMQYAPTSANSCSPAFQASSARLSSVVTGVLGSYFMSYSLVRRVATENIFMSKSLVAMTGPVLQALSSTSQRLGAAISFTPYLFTSSFATLTASAASLP